ncbi:MAG: DUF4214 domain-containing protein [Pseudomonadota bacterium]
MAAVDYTSVVQEIYLSYFGRPADRAGLINLTTALDNAGAPTTTVELDAAYATNNTVKSLLNNFGISAESQALYSGTNSQFVTAVFQNLFNRDPLIAGLDFWTNAIASGSVTRAQAAHAILSGAVEAAGADAALIANKVAVATNFTNAIDTAAEANAYSGAAAAAAARVLLKSVTAATNPTAFQPTVDAALANIVTVPTPPQTFSLTTGVDAILGSAANDTINARILNNANTLQSGDVVNGGAGVDRLNADIGNSQAFAITPETVGVETIAIRAQAVSTDSTDNNLSRANRVQIDAERSVGVTRWESNNSRADLLVEDVRIQDNQITKDITIAMVSTDPGHVDFGVYFDQASLRAAPAASSGATLRLQLMDTRSSDAGTAKLLSSPYNGFQFTLNGATIKVQSEAIDQAQSYADLLTAITAAVKNTPGLQNFVVSLGQNFTARDTTSGNLQTGQEIVLTNTGSGVITLDGTSGWTANGPVPANSGLHTNMSTVPATQTAFKVTSTILLDDVGRGSMGGDLVVGGLSIGDTSLSRGVERFEITVDRNSKLQTINSTNNTLEEVTIVNGVNSNANAGASNNGNLTVTGEVTSATAINNGLSTGFIGTTGATGTNLGAGGVTGPATVTSNNTSGGALIDAALPGTETVNGGDQHGPYGFSDVRLIDASTFKGQLNFNSVITERSINKYITTVDTGADAPTDNINFVYTGGVNNDTISVVMDAGVLASRSHLISGREDFSLSVNGGAGDDTITVRLADPVNSGNTQNWYNNQDLNNNVTITGGAGNDTIRKQGAGDTVIDGGTGNDTIYTDNTGVQTINVNVPVTGTATATSFAQFVFNTPDQTATGFAQRNVNDLRSDTNELYNLYNAKLTVTFKGIPNAVAVTIPGGAYKTTDLQINQAIKSAINNDAVLSKLLVAQDGPANSLIVKSMIDGALLTTDLGVSIALPAVGSLSATDIVAAATAYGIATPATATEAQVLTAMATALANFNTFGDYATAYGNDGTTAIAGVNSTATSDNLVTPGADNDVIVLGTTVGLTTAASSNEVVKYAAAFGNDSIINFAATGFGVDHFDFTALGGTTLSASFALDKSIAIATATVANNTEAKIAALFTDSVLTAQSHVYVAVGTDNIGTVYSVTDAAGVGGLSAVKQGTIDLADTLWGSLTAANFVDSSKADAQGLPFYLQEGPTGVIGVVTPPVVPGGVAQAVTAAANFDANVGAVTYTVAAPAASYTVNIANFAAADAIRFALGSSMSVSQASGTDGIIDISGSLAGQTVLVHLTGVATALDGAVFDVASFNAAFGAGSLVAA